MAGFTAQNFLSAATGMALAAALGRAFAGGGLQDFGNFWADIVRIVLYVLLPLALVLEAWGSRRSACSRRWTNT